MNPNQSVVSCLGSGGAVSLPSEAAVFFPTVQRTAPRRRWTLCAVTRARWRWRTRRRARSSWTWRRASRWCGWTATRAPVGAAAALYYYYSPEEGGHFKLRSRHGDCLVSFDAVLVGQFAVCSFGKASMGSLCVSRWEHVRDIQATWVLGVGVCCSRGEHG